MACIAVDNYTFLKQNYIFILTVTTVIMQQTVPTPHTLREVRQQLHRWATPFEKHVLLVCNQKSGN